MPMMPMQVLPEESRTLFAWVVFETQPHVGWHAAGWYPTEASAREAARTEHECVDGIIIRRVSFSTHERIR